MFKFGKGEAHLNHLPKNNNLENILEEVDKEKPLNNDVSCPVCGKKTTQSTFDRHIESKIESEGVGGEHDKFSKKYQKMKFVAHKFVIFKKKIKKELSEIEIDVPEFHQQQYISKYFDVKNFIDDYEKKYEKNMNKNNIF